jgi:dipeptidyl aminopeptidase/acylaminoacyl peptidase
MIRSFKWGLAALLCAGMAAGWVPPAQAQAQVDVGAFIRKDKFEDIKLSPNGEYYAATVPLEDRTVLVVMSRADNKLTGSFSLGQNNHIADFWWVNPERLVFSISQKFGLLDSPQLTGELYGMNADGGSKESLVGYRVQSRGPGTNIQPKKVEDVGAYLVDTLPDDDKYVIIMVRPFGELPFTRAERLDVYTGRRTPVARSPVPEADFVTDNKGVVRFAFGRTSDNANKLYYRVGDGAEWQLLNDEGITGRRQRPIGFSSDDATAYLSVENPKGPNSVVAMDVASGNQKTIFQDPSVSPQAIIYKDGIVRLDSLLNPPGRVPLGVMLMDGKARTVFFDEKSAAARLYRSLEAALPGQSVKIASVTRDGKTALVEASSDRNPGDFYLYRIEDKKVDYLVSRKDWFDPEHMAEVRPISLKSRDGLDLHGYVTMPGKPNSKLPLIVLPHGGPFGVRDEWTFEFEPQLLAAAGYAVLQVNFRGSGGYGRAFESAGARQWGLKMQDDLTDATRWAIDSGLADPSRICMYGASYGAYASLTGVAKEPALYKCAAGYVGVYDLPMMHTAGDTQRSRWGENFIKDWIGARSDVAAVSPTNMADRIKVPVFLAAGGEDERAPIAHSELMERRLKAAGVPVETLYYRTEGHGFYKEEHEREYYTRLLAFFHRHLGGATAK